MMKMLSYITVSLPWCTISYNGMLPQRQYREVTMCLNNRVRHVNIITYFALRNDMTLARYLLNQAWDYVSGLELDITLLTAEQILALFSNFDYTEDDATSVSVLLSGISHELLNPLVAQLYSISRIPHIVGYTHITRHLPDIYHEGYYQLERFYENYPEAEYILSLIPHDKEFYCKDAIESGEIDFNKADIRYLKLLVDNCAKTTHRYYYLAHALVYNEYVGDFDKPIIIQFLYNTYNYNRRVTLCNHIHDIVYLERLLTTRDSKAVLDRIMRENGISLPRKLPPKVHKIVAKYCLEGGDNIPLQLDDCKYCQRITQL